MVLRLFTLMGLCAMGLLGCIIELLDRGCVLDILVGLLLV